MDKKVTTVYHLIMTISIVITVIAIAFIDNNVYRTHEVSEATLINDNFKRESVGDTLTYTGTLPKSDLTGSVLCFYSSHALVEVVIDGELVYSLSPKEDGISNTTGYVWNEVSLDKNYSGKSVVIHVRSLYGKKVGNTSIYCGSPSAVIQKLFQEELSTILECLIIFLVGIILLFYSLINRTSKNYDLSTMHLAMFAILLALWTISDSHFTVFLFPSHIGLVFMTHLTLMLMSTPFILFLKSTFQDKEHFLWYAYAIANLVVCVVRIVLQLTGVSDFRASLPLTHYSIFALVCVIVYEIIRELRHNKLTKAMKFNFITCAIIIIPTIADLLYYQFLQRQGSFGRIGFLSYILIVSVASVKNSRENMERNRETEVYKKLAFIDELTSLFNRTAFQRDMENLESNLVKDKNNNSRTSILMFDLNDLKKCNDTYGHEYGDEYISMVANEIYTAFGSNGRCYRIGGDEFCVIVENSDENTMQNMTVVFERGIKKLNEQDFVVPISVAIGSAIYNPDVDGSLNDTRNRADIIMYAEKKRMKARRARTTEA